METILRKDADFTKKRSKTYYGYKGYIAMDEDSEVIKTVEFTKVSVHDSSVWEPSCGFDQLVDYTEGAIFADKGYANKSRSEKLEANGIFDGISEVQRILWTSDIRFMRHLPTGKDHLHI